MKRDGVEADHSQMGWHQQVGRPESELQEPNGAGKQSSIEGGPRAGGRQRCVSRACLLLRHSQRV